MKSYILSVVGMILLSVVVGLVLPEGRMAVYVKSMVALFLFFVVVSPILQVVSGSKKLEFETAKIDANFVATVNDSVVKNTKEKVEKQLLDNFEVSADVEILYETQNDVVCFVGARVLLEENDVKLNSDRLEEIKKQVALILKIDASEVKIDG